MLDLEYMDSRQMNKTSRTIIFTSLAFLLLLIVIARFSQSKTSSGTISQRRTPLSKKEQNTQQNASISTVKQSRPAEAHALLKDALESLKTLPDAKTARQSFSDLRRKLSAMATNEAIAAIRQLLDSKTDGSTHLGFKVGKDGLLNEAPTLRTFLLDELGRLDPLAAEEYAKIMLSNADSADEWAVALRNLARGDRSADGRSLVEQKMAELLRNDAWQQNPSVGYLEA